MCIWQIPGISTINVHTYKLHQMSLQQHDIETMLHSLAESSDGGMMQMMEDMPSDTTDEVIKRVAEEMDGATISFS